MNDCKHYYTIRVDNFRLGRCKIRHPGEKVVECPLAAEGAKKVCANYEKGR